MNSKSILRSAARVAAASVVLVGVVAGQGILKNGGTFTNSGTATYKEVQNYKTAAGTIVNSGTLNTTTAGLGSGDLINTDGATKHGTVRNFSGSTHGLIEVANNLNNNNAAASIDNDNAGVGRLRVAGSLTTAGTFDTDSGLVEYFGSGGQSVIATTYGGLVASVGGAKTMSGTVVVRDTFRITTGATFTTNATGDSLALLSVSNTNGGTFTPALGAVNYGADTNQTVFGGTYQRLYLSGATSARSKTTSSGLAFAASGVLNVGSNDTLIVSGGNLNLATNTPSFTNSSAVKVLADASFHGGITNAGSFYYAGTVAQAIGSVTYNNLRLGGSGGKNFPNSTVGVLGDYTLDSGVGARDYTSAGASATLAFQGTVGSQTVNNLTGEALNILEFSGAATKSMGGTSFSANRLNVLGTSGTVTNSITGTLTLANITSISMTVASGATFVNGATATISMNGDLENDGTITNAGTISVY